MLEVVEVWKTAHASRPEVCNPNTIDSRQSVKVRTTVFTRPRVVLTRNRSSSLRSVLGGGPRTRSDIMRREKTRSPAAM